MAMEINGNLIDRAVNKQNYNNYTTGYANTAKKTGSTDNWNEEEKGVKTSTVELKTSTHGVTKTAQIKTGFSNVSDYSKYLRGKYSYMNTGKTSMSGIPATVTVSSTFLKKCMNDPEKAKYLEENLAAIPDCVKSLDAYTRMMPGNPICTYSNYIIDDNGNITCMSGCTNDPDGRIARENAERKEREKKAAKEKMARRREEKKVEEEKNAKKRAEKAQAEVHIAENGVNEQGISVSGRSVESVTRWVISVMSADEGIGVTGFDVKA